MPRPTKFHEQLFKARLEQERHDLSLNPTFPHDHYPPEYRQFQRRRLNIRGVVSLLDHKDPVLRELAARWLKRIEPSTLKKHLSKEQVSKLEVASGQTFPVVKSDKTVRMLKDLLAKGKKQEIINLINDGSTIDRLKHIVALGFCGEKALEYLNIALVSEDPYLSIASIRALTSFGEKALPYLGSAIHAFRSDTKMILIDAFATIGPKSLQYLEHFANDPKIGVRVFLALKLPVVGIEALPLLQKLLADNSYLVVNEAKKSINIIEQKEFGKPLLMGSRESVLATSHIKALAERNRKISSIVSTLRKKHKDFIGLTIFGSTEKGYFTPESDLDYAVIGKADVGPDLIKECKAGGLDLCQSHIHVTGTGKNVTKFAPLFYGQFFGDREALRKLQGDVFSRLNEQDWNKIRVEILGQETNLRKGLTRSGVGFRETNRILLAAAQKVPPPHAEMKRLLGLK
ncbi:MAG: nucleotidyltransferase domain-containing protein [Candidatus ainarchaeum sp.]|nr:nucleotidyltransferase domain-containing protein [Candidatus ainarchaeum sp.]